MADLGASRKTPPHPGVDPQSWLGFEQRIQSRRFDALLTSTREAITHNNVMLAQHALDEAREIRPDAPEVQQLAAELRRLRPEEAPQALWRRAAGAVMLLAAGVLMFVGLDATRIAPGALPLVAPPPAQVLRANPSAGTFERGAIFADAIDVEDAEDEPVVGEDVVAPGGLPPRAAQPDRQEPPGLGVPRRTLPASTPTPAPATRADDDGEAARTEVPARIESAIRLDTVAPALVAGVDAAPAAVTSTAAAPAIVNVANVDRTADDRLQVSDVLRRYARAYGDLDVSAARAVWPGVDERALTRAFGSLASQSVSFDNCQIDVQGATAHASCRGQASYVGKVGRGAPRTEPRTWRFELRREGESWKIASAEARRITG